jgi:hypothetical protein
VGACDAVPMTANRVFTDIGSSCVQIQDVFA